MNSKVYESPLGRLMLTSDDGHTLRGLAIAPDAKNQGRYVPVFDHAIRWLDRYFAGKNPGEVPALTPRGTDFQLRVWNELCKVGYGQTVTYGELARRIGCRSAQAVGNAVGRNPVLIMIPCHRVVAVSGIGGFSAGLHNKVTLLRTESVL